MNALKYRLAKKEDATLLSALFNQVYMDTYGKEGITIEFVNFTKVQFDTKKIQTDINRKDCDLWIATNNSHPIAVLQVEYSKPCPVGKFTAPEINKLYTLRHFFGTGVAINLLKLAEGKLKTDGYNTIWLWVLSSNERAKNFYKKMDYQILGTAYFQMETNKYLNDVMRKTL